MVIRPLQVLIDVEFLVVGRSFDPRLAVGRGLLNRLGRVMTTHMSVVGDILSGAKSVLLSAQLADLSVMSVDSS